MVTQHAVRSQEFDLFPDLSRTSHLTAFPADSTIWWQPVLAIKSTDIIGTFTRLKCMSSCSIQHNGLRRVAGKNSIQPGR